MEENRTLVLICISLGLLLLLLFNYSHDQDQSGISVLTNSQPEKDKFSSVQGNFNSKSTDSIENTTLLLDQNLISDTEASTNKSSTLGVEPANDNNYHINNSELTDLQKHTLEKSHKILAKIRENCAARNISTVWNFRDKFLKPRLLIAKKEYHILYGSNPKTGSTSFKKFLFRIDGVTDEDHEFHRNAGGHYKTVYNTNFFENEADFNQYVKIMAIRNPIVRVVSAFRDKQLRHNKYFKAPQNITDSEDFALFVQNRLPKEKESDVHLQPQWHNMCICQFPYDLVVQIEEVGRYIPLIQKLTGTEHVEYPGSRKEQGTDSHDSMDFVNQYWAGLNEEQKQIILNKYSRDFEILGYTKFDEDGFPLLSYDSEITTKKI
ncbi:carbohydrate sulfotransferase 12-like [Bolinopsis microptera]|uniref:carbohydrate sulfotransferase 12-like n=1 Tax=Bolinopsis microptera TaxID=2820187 RepID=UPI00307A00A0